MQARVVETQARGQTGRVTGSSGLTDGWTDARRYPGRAQVRRLMARLSGVRGQLPGSAHVQPGRTGALLSVHKQRVLLPSPPVCSWLSGPQTGGDVCSPRHRQLLFLSAPPFLPPLLPFALHLSFNPLAPVALATERIECLRARRWRPSR